MTTTPRTDAEIKRNREAGHGSNFVRPEFAKKIETELIALQEENNKLKWHIEGHPQQKRPHGQLCPTCDVCTNHSDSISVLTKERDQLLATVEGLRKTIKDYLSRCVDCGGAGSYPRFDGEGTEIEQCQCQWCDSGLLSLQSIPPTNLVKPNE